MKTDLSQSCGHWWLFQICWHIECSTFTASSFRIWNSSTGIPSPPLALFIVMLPKAHLISHSRISGFRWVITPSCFSGSWRSFFVYSFCKFLPPLLVLLYLKFPMNILYANFEILIYIALTVLGIISATRWEQYSSSSFAPWFFQKAPLIFQAPLQLHRCPICHPHSPAMTVGLRAAAITRQHLEVPTTSPSTLPRAFLPWFEDQPLRLLTSVTTSKNVEFFHFILKGYHRDVFMSILLEIPLWPLKWHPFYRY